MLAADLGVERGTVVEAYRQLGRLVAPTAAARPDLFVPPGSALAAGVPTGLRRLGPVARHGSVSNGWRLDDADIVNRGSRPGRHS